MRLTLFSEFELEYLFLPLEHCYHEYDIHLTVDSCEVITGYFLDVSRSGSRISGRNRCNLPWEVDGASSIFLKLFPDKPNGVEGNWVSTG